MFSRMHIPVYLITKKEIEPNKNFSDDMKLSIITNVSEPDGNEEASIGNKQYIFI